jgi:hypothetical protein
MTTSSTLEVHFREARSSSAVQLEYSPSTYMKKLWSLQVHWVNLTGLSQFAARGPDGDIVDSYTLPVLEDVEFLLAHYVALEEGWARGDTRPIIAFVADGCFQFVAEREGENYHVNAGFYREGSPSLDGVVIACARYLDMWRSAAANIISAVASER